MSQLNGIIFPFPPLASWGTYSTFTLAKFKVTFSVKRSSPPEPPVVTEVIRTSCRLILTYSTGSAPPALRTVSSAVSKCVPSQQDSMIWAELLSMYLVTLRSCTLTLPLPAPPPTWAEPLFDIPHDQPRMSISLVCVLSFDSPSTPSRLRDMSTAIILSFYLLTFI